MHICLLTSKRPFEVLYGGEEKFTICFGYWLTHKGYEVKIIGRRLFGIEATQLYYVRDNAQNRCKSTSLPRVLLLPYPIAILGMLCASFLLLIKIVEVNHQKRISVIHAQDSYAGLAGLIASRLLKVPFVIHSHGLRLNTMSETLRGSWRFMLSYERILEEFTTKKANAIITVNELGKEYFVKGGVKREKIHVTPVGIVTSKFKVREEVRQALRRELGVPNDVVIGFVGRFSAEKNLFTLLDAFAEASKYANEMKLILVGTGPMEGKLKALCYNRNMNKKVIFTGTRYDINRLLSVLDIFVLPSYTEGCPTSLLEAMASGKAIIASDISSVREIARGDQEVILVDPRDVEELKQAILLLYNNPNLRAKLGHASKVKARLFDVDMVYGNIVNVYEEIASRKAKNALL